MCCVRFVYFHCRVKGRKLNPLAREFRRHIRSAILVSVDFVNIFKWTLFFLEKFCPLSDKIKRIPHHLSSLCTAYNFSCQWWHWRGIVNGIHEMSFTIPFRNLNCRSDWGGISSQGASCGIIYLKNISPNIKGRLKGFLRFLKEVRRATSTREEWRRMRSCDPPQMLRVDAPPWSHFQGISHQGSVPVHQGNTEHRLTAAAKVHTH